MRGGFSLDTGSSLFATVVEGESDPNQKHDQREDRYPPVPCCPQPHRDQGRSSNQNITEDSVPETLDTSVLLASLKGFCARSWGLSVFLHHGVSYE